MMFYCKPIAVLLLMYMLIYSNQTLSSVKPFPKPLHYTVLYRRSYSSLVSEELNAVWREARHSLAATLHIPSEQVGWNLENISHSVL